MGCISKYGLSALNVVVVVVGLAVVGVASAILHQDNLFDVFLTQVFFSIPLGVLLGGIFLTLLGVLGVVGALRENTCMLVTYSMVVSLLLFGVLVVGGGLLALTTNASAFLYQDMMSLFERYGEDLQLSHDLDLVQNTLHCCGVESYEDWYGLPYGVSGDNVADGCCRNMTDGCGKGLLNDPSAEVETLVYTQGCLGFVIDALGALGVALTVLTLALAGFQLLSIIWACLIVKDAKRRPINTEVKHSKNYQTLE